MEPAFIRIFDKASSKEILINVNAISEIHVEYVVKGQGTQKGVAVGLGEGRTNPDALRIYHVFVGGMKHTLPANPGSPVMQVLEEIYKKAIKNDN